MKVDRRSWRNILHCRLYLHSYCACLCHCLFLSFSLCPSDSICLHTSACGRAAFTKPRAAAAAAAAMTPSRVANNSAVWQQSCSAERNDQTSSRNSDVSHFVARPPTPNGTHNGGRVNRRIFGPETLTEITSHNLPTTLSVTTPNYVEKVAVGNQRQLFSKFVRIYVNVNVVIFALYFVLIEVNIRCW